MACPECQSHSLTSEHDAAPAILETDLCELLISGVSEAEADRITKTVTNYRAALKALRELVDGEDLVTANTLCGGPAYPKLTLAAEKARTVLAEIDGKTA